MNLREQVKEFHEAFGVEGDRLYPGEQTKEIRALRAALIAEEFFELLLALGIFVSPSAIEHIRASIEHPIGETDLPALADAMADLDYVVEGTRLAFGIDGRPIAWEVHRANMAKIGGPRREDGKILKPEGWEPPDIVGRLKDQGWKP